MDIASTFKEYGLLGLIMGSVITLLFFVVKWTLATTKDIMTQAAAERKNWMETIALVNQGIMEHTAQAREFHNSVKEAHEHQRREHERLQESMDKTCQCLTEVEKGLSRMNGFGK